MRILNLWPKDLLRPNVSFQNTTRARIDKAYNVKKMEVEANEVLASPPKPVDEDSELKQVNALYSLLDNRYTKQVCHNPSSSSSRAILNAILL